jgi:hypothetical protein
LNGLIQNPPEQQENQSNPDQNLLTAGDEKDENNENEI